MKGGSAMTLTDEQKDRYNRHLLLRDIGISGQEKILKARVLVVGTGGLGSAVLLYLAAAGIGTLGVADGDVVDRTNLQRQVIHFTDDLGRSKVISAKEKINRINPDVQLLLYQEMLSATNIMDIISGYDFVVDATDNFSSKYLINDACVLSLKPFSHASVIQFVGQTMTIIPKKTACFRCFFPEPPPPGRVPSSKEVGVMGPAAGAVGTLQATEIIKFLVGIETILANRLLVIDTLEMKFRRIKITRQPDCPVCGANPKITRLTD
jgi:molybdopterin-synthase adenylyltransferase